jgi:hypothetical protein
VCIGAVSTLGNTVLATFTGVAGSI